MRTRTEPSPLPTWLTIAEAAERLSVSEKTVRRLIASADIPARRFGKRLIRIDADQLTGTPLGVR